MDLFIVLFDSIRLTPLSAFRLRPLAGWVVGLNPLKSREGSSDASEEDSPNLSALRIAGFYATVEIVDPSRDQINGGGSYR